MNLAYKLADFIAKPEKAPYRGWQFVDIGPECFGYADGSVICWKGVNYVPQKATVRVRLHNWLNAVGTRRERRRRKGK